MRTLVSKEGIKETAKELFFKYGIKRISVEEISEKIGISKVTFYKYYKNKMELAYELRDDLMREGFDAFDAINALDIPFTEKINLMTNWQIEFYSRMNNDFVKEIVDLDQVRGEFKKRFLENLKSGQDKGEVRKDLNLELIFLISQKMQEIGKEGSWKGVFSDFGEYVRQTREILFFGMLERPSADGREKK